MITFDQLHAALLDADPHVALDRLIRDEQAAGRSAQTIYDELLNHVEGLRGMPGYTDELEDPLGDKLDALCGWIYTGSGYGDTPAPDPSAQPRPAAEANGHGATKTTRPTPQA
jgi:hypothetical protein